MTEQNHRDMKVTAFLVFIAALIVIALFSEGSSYRAGGGLVVGPVLIGYALHGLSKGRFLELSQSGRDKSPKQFWFVFWAYVVAGIGGLGLGIQTFLD